MKKLAKTVFSLALALCLVLSLGGAAFAETYYIEDGDIAVNASESGQTVSQGTNINIPDAAPVISNRTPETPSSNTVTINAEAGSTANVTFDDLNINVDSVAPVQVTGEGNVNIELDHENSLCVFGDSSASAALEKNDSSSKGTLTITDTDGDGKLTARSTQGFGAGIGGSAGNSTSNITIEGGEITASAVKSAAGIGGGSAPNTNTIGGSAENIRITGGKVDATGGDGGGAGIGSGGRGEYARDIVISGDADVTATGNGGAGIGGGYNCEETSVTISGNAKVNATSVIGGAIGSGEGGSVDSIVISDNAVVTAKVDTEQSTYGARRGVPFGAGYGKDFAPDTSKLTSNGSVKTIDRNKNEKTIVGTYVPGASAAVSAAAPVYARYYVIDGKNAEWLRDSGEELTFLLNSDKVEKVVIDGTEVEFEINPDGEVVISAELLQALDNGQHEIEFIFADGSCKTTFTIK